MALSTSQLNTNVFIKSFFYQFFENYNILEIAIFEAPSCIPEKDRYVRPLTFFYGIQC